jgi:hypothetical protein
MQNGRKLQEITKMTNPEQPRRKRGRPPKYAGEGKRQNFSFRITAKMRERLIAAVKESGRSISEEIEFRIGLSFSFEEAKGDIDKMRAEMAAMRSAARVEAIRAAGIQILREIEGRPTRVVIDLETLLAEADGIARGLRSGFVPINEPPPAIEPPRRMTPEEAQRAMEELEEIKRKLNEAAERTRAADAAAAAKDEGEAA